jgi:hypothetical protein
VSKTHKNHNAVALGRLGGKKGGPARADALSPARREAIAREGGRARQRQKNGRGK